MTGREAPSARVGTWSVAFAMVAACQLCGCLLPHVERLRPRVHGVVTRDGIPLRGVSVARCPGAASPGCPDGEHATTGADGAFELPAVRRFAMFIPPYPVDPIREYGFDLGIDAIAYCGIRRSGIGAPPDHYEVRCELIGAATSPTGPDPARCAKPACEVVQ